jgi:hypothetical protein
MLAKLIMAKPPPIFRSASRRVTGFGFSQDMGLFSWIRTFGFDPL